MAFLVAITSLPAVYRPNNVARTTTTGTPHAHAKRIPVPSWFTSPDKQRAESRNLSKRDRQIDRKSAKKAWYVTYVG